MTRLILVLCALCVTTLTWGQNKADTAVKFPANGANYKRFSAATPPLVPLPQVITWGDRAIELQSVRIVAPKPESTSYPEQMKLIVKELEAFLQAHDIAVGKEGGYTIKFETGKVETATDNPKLQAEAYSIKSTPKGALVKAADTRGFFYAMKTLEQLILRRNGKTTIAACELTDYPDFEVRGFTNDVGRNYMPLSLIKQEIDSMAQLKLNVYHFHVTDDPGWRLESKLYPQLNEAKSFTRMPGKFYTQKEFKDLVEYCRLRNITVIPELDMPGHSQAFRKALGVKSMKEEKAVKALEDLIKELCSLVPAEHMPIVHIGTDEVRNPAEYITQDILRRYINAVESCGRTPMQWHHGQELKGYNGEIQHLWSGRQNRKAWPKDGAKYIDSLENYINHLDPFEVAMNMYFKRPCPFGNAEGLGMLLCSWPDKEITDPRNQVLQTPVYSAMAFGSESLWNNPHEAVTGDPNGDEYLKYFSNLPVQGDPLLEKFAEYENRVLAIRDRFFVNKEFNYVRQAHIPWKLLGPIPNGGKTEREFEPENDIKNGKLKDSYTIDGKTYEWSKDTYTGGTLIFKHYCDFPTLFNGAKMGAHPYVNHTYYAQTWIYSPKVQKVPFWVSGHTWATSDWAHGPVSVPGKWFHADPKFFVNGKEIQPPMWKKPNNNGPMVDENYHFRAPTMIDLKKGWNQVLVKSPNNKRTRRWMFTFVPVQVNGKTPGCNVKEFPGLKFSVDPK